MSVEIRKACCPGSTAQSIEFSMLRGSKARPRALHRTIGIPGGPLPSAHVICLRLATSALAIARLERAMRASPQSPRAAPEEALAQQPSAWGFAFGVCLLAKKNPTHRAGLSQPPEWGCTVGRNQRRACSLKLDGESARLSSQNVYIPQSSLDQVLVLGPALHRCGVPTISPDFNGPRLRHLCRRFVG
jgi:hypothetical protein